MGSEERLLVGAKVELLAFLELLLAGAKVVLFRFWVSAIFESLPKPITLTQIHCQIRTPNQEDH